MVNQMQACGMAGRGNLTARSIQGHEQETGGGEGGQGNSGFPPPLPPQQPRSSHEPGGRNVEQSVEGAETSRGLLVRRILPLGGTGYRSSERPREAKTKGEIRRALLSHQIEEHRR
jgi:hypothetical protein